MVITSLPVYYFIIIMAMSCGAVAKVVEKQENILCLLWHMAGGAGLKLHSQRRECSS